MQRGGAALSVGPAPTLPNIRGRKSLDLSGRYAGESIDLQFTNGECRIFERIAPRGPPGVLVVPILNATTVLLIREYAAAFHRYEIGLVKGRVDPGQEILAAANRELQEEAGYRAGRLTELRRLTLVPSFMAHETALVLAEDLEPSRLPGDEPEPPEVLPWRLDALSELMLRPDCSEARSLAALFIVREHLANR